MITEVFIHSVTVQDDGKLLLTFGDGKQQANCVICSHATYVDTVDEPTRFFNVNFEVIGPVNPDMP